MIIKGQLLSATNLNNAYISKTDTNAQSINSTLTISGGALTLKNSTITDNANTTYLKISPQGNNLILYDGVNNQKMSVYSSSGSETTYMTTINGSPSYGLIDVSSALDHLGINISSLKPVIFGGNITSSRLILNNNYSHLQFQESGSNKWHFESVSGNMNFVETGVTNRMQLSPSTGNLTLLSGKLTAQTGVSIKGTNLLSFDDYGGGFNMNDTSWIRVTGGKSFYLPTGTLRTDGILQVGSTGYFYASTSGVAIGGSVSPRNKLDVIGGGVVIGTNIQSPTTFQDGTLTVGNTSFTYSGGQGGEDWAHSGNTITLQAKDYSTIGFLQASTRVDYIRGGAGSLDIGYDGGWGRSNILLTNGIWNNSGNVGINTQSPSAPLHVNAKAIIGNGGDSRSTNGLSVSVNSSALYGANSDSTDANRTLSITNPNSAVGSYSLLNFRVGASQSNDTLFDIKAVSATGQAGKMIFGANYSSAYSDIMTLQTNGNIGVGSTSPLRKLDINGDSRINGNIYSGQSYLGFLTDAGVALPVSVGSLSVTSSYPNSAPSNGLYVQGNTGIGTNSPSGKFHVVESAMQMYTSGDHLYLQKIGGSQFPYIGFLDSGGTRGGYIGWGTTGSLMEWALENGNKLYIHGGNVGIGVSNPLQVLDVGGNIQNNGTFISNSTSADIFQALGSSGTKTFRFEGGNLRFWSSQTGVGEALTIANNGSIGIQQPSPSSSYKLDVNGDIRATGKLWANANNSSYLRGGDDAEFWDINVANTTAIYGVENSAVGGLKLGSTGATIYGSGGTIGINTTSPYTSVALDINGSIRVAKGSGIWSAYNNNYIFNDHNNGNVSISSAGGDLYLGYQNTGHVRFEQPLYTNSGATLVADTSGKIYYQGNDIDSRYVNTSGDSMTSDLSFSNQQNGIGISSVSSGGVIKTSGSWITGGNDAIGLSNGINDIAIQSWYGVSISPTFSGGTVARGNPAFSVNARTGDTYIAGDFYPSGNVNLVPNSSVNGISYLYGQNGTILRSTDSWLRINDYGSVHSSGVYFGTSIVRTDGTLQVGNNGQYFTASSSMISANGLITAQGGVNTYFESHFSHGTYADPAVGRALALKVAQGIGTDYLTVNGNIDMVGPSAKLNISGNSGDASIEIRSNAGGYAYIDFSQSSTVDYTARLICGGGYLQVQGIPLMASNGEVFSKGHNLTFGTGTPTGGSSGDIYVQI